VKALNPSSTPQQFNAAPEQATWTVSVEVKDIDFMDRDSVFVAGSGTDCSSISAIPVPRARRARKPNQE